MSYSRTYVKNEINFALQCKSYVVKIKELFASWFHYIFLLSSADFFQNLRFFKNIIRASNYLDPNQNRRAVGSFDTLVVFLKYFLKKLLLKFK